MSPLTFVGVVVMTVLVLAAGVLIPAAWAWLMLRAIDLKGGPWICLGITLVTLLVCVMLVSAVSA